ASPSTSPANPARPSSASSATAAATSTPAGWTGKLTAGLQMTCLSVPYAATVLAGGRSTRMGQDKAGLSHPATGEPLLLHQLNLLRQLHPAPTHLAVSARHGQALPRLPADAQRIDDD